jgi:Ca2+-binding RTX toxin-like protein
MTKHPTPVVIGARNGAANHDARPLVKGGGRQDEGASSGRASQVTGQRRWSATPRSRTLRLVRAAGLVAPVVLLAAGAPTGCTPTPGGTASVTSYYSLDSTLHFDAVSGRNNSITVSLGTPGTVGPSSLLLTDSSNPVAPGPGCTRLDLNTVRCDTTAGLGFSGQLIGLGDGDDTFADSVGIPAVPAVVHAGAGDDTVNGGAGNDVVYEDSDGLDQDSFTGGAGSDWVRYVGVMHGVHISLNDVADDGRPGENDNVKSDIENISGTGNADTLTGDSAGNAIFALHPDDTGVSVDQLTGGVVINGGGGNDAIWGTNWGSPDRLSGDTGDDTVEGFAGDDLLSGGAGNDYLRGGEGFDALDGGTETDYCDVGPGGGTTVNCESGP